MYLTAVVNMEESKRHLLKQPYLNHTEPQRQRRQQAKEAPYRTKEEAVSFIFEGF